MCVSVCASYICARMTQPAECFFLTAMQSGFSVEKNIFLYINRNVCVFLQKKFFFFFLNHLFDRVVGWCAQFHISASVHSYIQSEDVKKSLILCGELVCTFLAPFRRLLSSFETCVHTRIHAFEFGIRFDIRVCVKRFHCLWPKWEIKKKKHVMRLKTCERS